ncbi:MAG: glycine cleavage system protein GcvH [Planctomycetaceae bacterium]
MDPSELMYARTHEWVHRKGDVATIGISDFAVKELTDLVYIDLPAVGRTVAPGDTFGEVESVKAVSDLYSPVAGEIIEVNESLPDNLQLLSDEPFGRGWIVKVRLAAGTSLDHLMDHASYQKFCEEA